MSVEANRLRRMEALWLPAKAVLVREPQSAEQKGNVRTSLRFHIIPAGNICRGHYGTRSDIRLLALGELRTIRITVFEATRRTREAVICAVFGE